MNVRSESSVLTERRSRLLSRNELTSGMLAGVGRGVDKADGGNPGVGGDVAEGIVYESRTSILARDRLPMTGWRLELGLIVLKLNFLSSGVGSGDPRGCEALDMVDTRRIWGPLGTQRRLSVRPWSSVQQNS
jgi:hypothetical protein